MGVVGVSGDGIGDLNASEGETGEEVLKVASASVELVDGSGRRPDWSSIANASLPVAFSPGSKRIFRLLYSSSTVVSSLSIFASFWLEVISGDANCHIRDSVEMCVIR